MPQHPMLCLNLTLALVSAALLLSACAQAASGAAAPTADFFVAPNGNDESPGTRERPFATLDRARRAVRERIAAGPARNLTVLIRGGTYRLTRTILFDLNDSAGKAHTVTYAGHPGEKPVFTSGTPIRGWRKFTGRLAGLPAAAKGKLWVADVPDGLQPFCTLYDGSRRLPRARSRGFAPTRRFQKWRGDAPRDRYEMAFPPGACQWPHDWKGVELLIIPTADWTMNILPVASVDRRRRVLKTSVPSTHGLGAQRDPRSWAENAWIENTPNALDEPGEWILDVAARKVYYWPKAGPPGERIAAPALTELIRVEGKIDFDGPADTPVRGLIFRGLTFTCGRRDTWDPDHIGLGLQHDWDMYDRANALVRFRGAEGCALEDCRFVHTSGSAVRMDLHAQQNRITGCTLDDVGGTGILLCGYGPGTKDVSHHNTISNNHIQRTGQLYWHAPGIFLWQSGSNTVTHNLVHHTPYTGIIVSGKRGLAKSPHADSARTVRWHEVKTPRGYPQSIPFMHARENRIAYNEVHHTMLRLGDGNAVYLSGAGEGNRIEHNYIHHILGARMASAVRTDEHQRGTVFSHNLIYRCRHNGFIIKDVNHVENNIIACIGPRRWGKDGYISFRGGPNTESRIRRNIFYHTGPKYEFIATVSLRHLRPVDIRTAKMDHNLYYTPGDQGAQARAWLAHHQETTGLDKHSLVADPLFVDPAKGDFRLKRNSPARKLGFEPIDVSQMGLRAKPGKTRGE